jgi:antitoxin HicB
MSNIYKVPLILELQPEGGFTVTSPVLPEVITEGDDLEEVMANVQDAVKAVVELYEDLGKALPSALRLEVDQGIIQFECLVAGA